MLGYLGPRITNLAMFSLSSNDAPLQVILALLLLCTWPVLIKTLTKGVTHVLSGAAMHLAMQIGLHVFGIGQDFAGSRLRPDNKEKTLRARIWLQCLIVCQRYGDTFKVSKDTVNSGQHELRRGHAATHIC